MTVCERADCKGNRIIMRHNSLKFIAKKKNYRCRNVKITTDESGQGNNGKQILP